MATIVKSNTAAARTAAVAAAPDSDLRPPNHTASARIIKTVSPSDPPAGTANSQKATTDVHQAKAATGVAGKISGATIGNLSKVNAGLADFNLADLADQGREQLKQCRQQVEAMMEEARHEAEKLKHAAKTQGHSEGRQAAATEIDQRIAREADAKATARVESLHKTVVQMREQYEQWMQQYADVLTRTALAVAERLTLSQLTLPTDPASDNNDHLIVRWAREALHSTRSASRLTLAVHPDTLASLGKAFDELLAHPDLPEQSVVIPDETLSIGDIVVRQDGGEISAGLDAQLARLHEELL